MENLIEVTTAGLVKENFKNKKLFTQMNNISKACDSISKATDDTAKALAEIKNGELFKKDFGTFKECVEHFGINYKTACDIVKLYTLREELGLHGYILNKIKELRSVPAEMIIQANDNGEIAPTMTVLQLREWVKSVKALPIAEEVESEEEKSEEDESEEVESEEVESEEVEKVEGIRITIQNGEQVVEYMEITGDVLKKILKILDK